MASSAVAAAILDELGRRGAKVWLDGATLRVRPKSVLTEALSDTIRRHKAAILAALPEREIDPESVCGVCSMDVWAYGPEGQPWCQQHAPEWLGGAGVAVHFTIDAASPCGECWGTRFWTWEGARHCVGCDPHPSIQIPEGVSNELERFVTSDPRVAGPPAGEAA